MKALVFNGPSKKVWKEKDKPIISAQTDAIVKILKTTICGTDLHILKGDVPSVKPGTTLGHEGIGIVDKVGDNVMNFKKGDKVLISCITSCGKCNYCKKGMYSHCENGGWILGNLIDGTQAEFVRIPYADNSLYHLPDGVDENASVMLSDIFPTALECGVLNGKIEPGSVVAIVGAGPVGLAALLTAQFYSPAEIIMIDVDENRLKIAKKLGAAKIINSNDGKSVQKVMEMTNNIGVDTAIEAVGIPETFDICQMIIAPGGCIANVGVHGKSVDLRLEDLWAKNITITTRLVDTITTPLLLKILNSGKLDADKLITHEFNLNDIIKSYNTFANAKDEKALKVILNN